MKKANIHTTNKKLGGKREGYFHSRISTDKCKWNGRMEKSLICNHHDKDWLEKDSSMDAKPRGTFQ